MAPGRAHSFAARADPLLGLRAAVTTPLLVLDSVTTLDAGAHGTVAIAASHCGVIAAHLALHGGIVAVVLNDAGIGRDGAGIGGLAWADRYAVPCAAIDHRSARIGDGADCAARGVVSHVNAAAARLGVRPGMTARAAALRFCAAGLQPIDPGPLPGESREVIALPGGVRPLVLIDSVSLTEPSDVGAVVFTGSHGGLQGGLPETAIGVAAFAALYNDAGVGIDDAGVSRLPVLDTRGIAGATVASMSARIGSARSALDTGVLSRVNRTAAAYGAQPGMTAQAFAALTCKRSAA